MGNPILINKLQAEADHGNGADGPFSDPILSQDSIHAACPASTAAADPAFPHDRSTSLRESTTPTQPHGLPAAEPALSHTSLPLSGPLPGAIQNSGFALACDWPENMSRAAVTMWECSIAGDAARAREDSTSRNTQGLIGSCAGRAGVLRRGRNGRETRVPVAPEAPT